jgi:hypothetical protein
MMTWHAVSAQPAAVQLRRRTFGRFKPTSVVSAIAERTFLGRTTATQGDRFLAAQVKRIPFRIFDSDGTGYEQGTVIANIDFNIRHIQVPFRFEGQAVGPQPLIHIQVRQSTASREH